jgi:hypothetical protein
VLRTSVIWIAMLALLAAAHSAGAVERRARFDHRTTGFELLGRHRDLPCEACHVKAVFRGTPRRCVACHGAGTAVRATAKPDNHILTTDRCGACHTPIAWLPAVNFDHTQTLGSCSSCHNNVQAQGKGAQHISTALECNACHGTLDWAGARFNHAGITGNCASCHDGTQAPGMPAAHIPTSGAPCEDCHLPTQFTTFDGAVMDHAVVASMPCTTCHEAGKSFTGTPAVVTRPPAPHPATGECSSCHSTTTFSMLGQLPANHIPLPAADGSNCSLCHSDLSNYAVYVMNHVNITSNCAQCHGSGLAFTNMAPPVLKEFPSGSPPHIPINGAPCEDCHQPTQFTSFDGSVMDHAVVASIPCTTCHEAGKSFIGTPTVVTRPPAPHPTTGECSNCHSTSTFAGAAQLPANHIPLPAADASNCSLCHTNPSDYSVYVMNHVNITSNCAQCHDSGLAFANMAPPTLKEPPAGPPPHIPSGTLACELCHVATNFTTFSGTVMRHAAVVGQACDSCHELGMAWYGEPNLWVRPSADHHPGQDCGNSGCHTPQDKRAFRPPPARTSTPATAPAHPARAPGTTVAARIAGSPAARAPVATPAATLAGRSPPRVAGISGGLAALRLRSVDHSRITGACVSCHNGRIAIGEPLGHFRGSSRCEYCHTTNAWLPARVDHTAMTPQPCTTCHNGVQAIGMPSNHVATVQQCGACHGTLAWTPVRVDHSMLVSGCARCHNGFGAIGMPASHMRTRRDCADCHRYPDWSVMVFRHTSAAYPAGHRADLPCTACHKTNTEQVQYSTPAAAGTCGGCHARGVPSPKPPKRRPGPHGRASNVPF